MKKKKRSPSRLFGAGMARFDDVETEPVIEPERELTELELAQERYLQTTNGMCLGVGYAMGFDQDETTPKHLRIGVNMALIRAEALVALLLDKGIFTELEWIDTLTRLVEQERRRYEELLAKHMGAPVELNRPQEAA